MLKHTLLLTSLLSFAFAQSAEDFAKEQMQGFSQEQSGFDIYKKSQEEAFAAYEQEQMQAYNDYKKEIGALWDDPKLSTKKKMVNYTEDKKTRTDVDFEKESIQVETIASSPQEAEQKLKEALSKVITIDTKELQESDPLEQKLAKVKKPVEVKDDKVDAKPILAPVLFEKKPTQADVDSYVSTHVKPSKIQSTDTTKLPHQKVYSISVKLPSDTMLKRSQVYYQDVKKEASRQKIPLPLVFAIMHSESSFNPKARSHIPAYGLLQIVPKSAGIDAYNFLYKQKKLVSGSYLYNSKNNIEMGVAYMHILYYKYLKDIKDPDARLYCTIAAYNTGAGNIAWAFTKSYNMKKAAPIINSFSPQEVYNRLLRDLRYDEPKHYLKNVTKRMGPYYQHYGA
ncbi:MAG: murein transglycosylase domain-containing protein [Sulfurimonas sp.]|jgi:membrane-bound lytic murein transglycosylase C|nr:murein transglycosylase domain-containing protein [Sulfurimonas sp.]